MFLILSDRLHYCVSSYNSYLCSKHSKCKLLYCVEKSHSVYLFLGPDIPNDDNKIIVIINGDVLTDCSFAVKSQYHNDKTRVPWTNHAREHKRKKTKENVISGVCNSCPACNS